MSRQLKFASALLLVSLLLSCRHRPDIGESTEKYSIRDSSHVPYIVVARTIESSAAAGPVTRSARTGRYTQVWKARLEIENVLHGDLRPGPVDVFYLMRDDIPGSFSRLILTKGERDILFLEKDGPTLRTICDAAQNCCSLKVLTGAHPGFVRPPAMTIEEAIAEIELTRGLGPNGKLTNDGQMIRAIDQFQSPPNYHEEPVLQTLRHLESGETPLVAEAACAALRQRGQRCTAQVQSEPARKRPSVQIESATHAHQQRTYRPGERIRITVVGAPHERVYRNSTDGGKFSTVQVGPTDNAGRFAIEELASDGSMTRTEVWSVGNRAASPALTYTQLALTGKGQLVTTPISDPRDRYGMAVSAISALGNCDHPPGSSFP